MKPCNKCGIIKPFHCFAMNRKRADRLHNMCRDCNKLTGKLYRARLRLKNGQA